MTYTIHHGDALDVLRGMPACSVDAVVTDPPYCSGGFTEAAKRASNGSGLRSETRRDGGWFVGDNMGASGLAFLLRSVAVDALRIAKPSASLLVFCDWRMLATLQPAIESAGWRSQNLVVWDKKNAGLGRGFRAQHELIMHFTAGAPEYHDASTGNVITCNRMHHADREHQTQKPEELMRRLLRVVCPPGGTVLDPFTGSGSTGVACIAEGFHFIGVEREAEYVEIARARLAAASLAPQQVALAL